MGFKSEKVAIRWESDLGGGLNMHWIALVYFSGYIVSILGEFVAR
jgi:hypothetical protein